MSGHSRWSNIKRKKDTQDKKKGALFNRISKELIVAARLFGPDPLANSRLRIAITRARNANMANDTIERSIKKGAGELDGVSYEEIIYEVFAKAGVALIVNCLTDKKSRTTPEIKNILSKHGANLSEANAVLRMFEKKGVIQIQAFQKVIKIESKNNLIEFNENTLFELVADLGAEDLTFIEEDEIFEITTSEKNFSQISDALNNNKIPILESEVKLFPSNINFQITINDLDLLNKIMKLIDALEEHEDVQAVYSNLNISKELFTHIK